MFTDKTTGWVLTKEDNKTLHSVSELPFFPLTFMQAKIIYISFTLSYNRKQQ